MKIEINAVLREAKGTGASRRLRHQGKFQEFFMVVKMKLKVLS